MHVGSEDDFTPPASLEEQNQRAAVLLVRDLQAMGLRSDDSRVSAFITSAEKRIRRKAPQIAVHELLGRIREELRTSGIEPQ
jgi:hypothetical protein